MPDPALTEAIRDLTLQVRRLVLTKIAFEDWTEDDMRVMGVKSQDIWKIMQCRSGVHEYNEHNYCNRDDCLARRPCPTT